LLFLLFFCRHSPISLYISIEFVRTAQAAFIYWDHGIKYVKDGVTTRTTARSWNLSDDLGQIEYIFSDKTGTLTQNVMVFRQCSIGGKIYTGEGKVPDNIIVDGQKNSLEKSDSPSSNSSDTPINRAAAPNNPDTSAEKPKVAMAKEVLARFHDAGLLVDLNDTETEQSRLLNGFFAVLGLCHTVLAAGHEKGVIEYKAQSPDEAALVQAAADVGFIFQGRDRNILKLITPFSDVPDEYELLQVLEFNSTRKRMSVVIRKLDEQQRIFLLCKGADNVIFERLAPGNEELKQKTDADLQYFASEGLRTLCLAYRVVPQEEYDEWNKLYHWATVSLEERAEKLDAVSDQIEQGLTLLGATAIEDRLQDGVPETIADLKRAGIKVWVATGDKLETAVAIGYTTNLLTKDTNLIIVREGGVPIYDQLKSALEGFFGEKVMDGTEEVVRENSVDRGHELHRMNTGVTSLVGTSNGMRTGGFSLVIDGGALHHVSDQA
jgi:phospholipid-translocating ATPase